MAICWNDETTGRREWEALADKFEGSRGIGGENTGVIRRGRVKEVEYGVACRSNMLVGTGGTECITIR
jgi:hypothetical protein